MRPGHPESITQLINDLCSAPASSNARNYTQWATQTTFINVEFFNSIFLRYLMIYDLSLVIAGGLITPVLPGSMSPISRWHEMTSLDMITNNLPEQSGPETPGQSWNQWKPISNLLLASPRYFYQRKQKGLRLRYIREAIGLQTWKKFNWINPSLCLSQSQPQPVTHSIPRHDHVECDDMTSESWWSVTVMAC